MTPEEVKAGQFYTLKEPEWTKTFGQGEHPLAMRISFPDKEYSLPWGTVFKASDTCDPEHAIANMNATPYPLIRVAFILDHIEQFEPLTTEVPADGE